MPNTNSGVLLAEDETTRPASGSAAKLDKLQSTVHRKCSALLCYIMQWGLSYAEGWTIDQCPVVAVPPVPVLLEPELHQQVQDAAAAHGASVAAWLREAVRRVTVGDFPASWRTVETVGRSHASGYYGWKHQLRLDEATSHKLEALTRTFDCPAAEVIRQLVLQARLEDFPQSWQLAAQERRLSDRASRSSHDEPNSFGSSGTDGRPYNRGGPDASDRV